MAVKVRFLLFVGLAMLVVTQLKVQALGQPNISVDKSSPQPVGTCLNVTVSVTWDNDFRSMRVRFANEGWQESSETHFTRQFCTNNYSAGTYTITAQVAGKNDNNWSNPNVAQMSYTLTGNSQPPTPTSAPANGPSFSVSFNPGSAQIGQGVTIHVSVNSSNPGATKITVPCGGVDKVETSEVTFDSHWNTNGCGAGNQTITICSRTVSDPQWLYANCQTLNYSVTGVPPPNAPTANFWADTYTLQPGQCTTMHWQTQNANSVNIDGNSVNANGDQQICPSATKKYSLRASNGNASQDATRNFTVQVTVNPPPAATNPPPQNCNGVLPPHLVVGQNAVVTQAGDNLNLRAGDGTGQPLQGTLSAGTIVVVVGGPRCTNGYQWWQIQTPSQGTWWAVEADGNNYWLDLASGFVGQPPPANPSNPGSGNCPPSPSRLHPGDIALVSDFDPEPLRVYNTQDVRSGLIFTVPIREQVSIISEPVCAWNVIWVEVSYQGKDGWAIEANDKGSYNLIPNGMPLPGPGGKSQQPPIPTFTSVPAVQPPPQAVIPISCGELGFLPPNSNTGMDVYAAEIPDISGYAGQCTYYVMTRYYGLLVCWLAMPNAFEWVNLARHPDQTPSRRTDCVTSVNPSNGSVSASNPARLDLVQLGDIAVWQPGCGGAGDSGHVAIVAHIAGDQMTFDEENWGGPSTRRFDLTCMTFIRIPQSLRYSMGTSNGKTQYPPYPEYTASWIIANKVHIACAKCSSPLDWIQVNLPTGVYDSDSLSVHLAYMDLDASMSVSHVEINGGTQNDTVTLHLADSPELAQAVASLTLQQLQNASAWYVTFGRQ